MSGQKQHVEIHSKLALRRRLCSNAAEGAVYVPFVGDGDIAAQLYSDRRIYAADVDPARAANARRVLPSADIRVADCNGWPFPDTKDEFAIADLDAYSNPYQSLRAFWRAANKAQRVILFGTDGMRQAIKRNVSTIELPSGKLTKLTITEARAQYNYWATRHIRPWLEAELKPWRIREYVFYLRRDIVYWGARVENA